MDGTLGEKASYVPQLPACFVVNCFRSVLFSLTYYCQTVIERRNLVFEIAHLNSLLEVLHLEIGVSRLTFTRQTLL